MSVAEPPLSDEQSTFLEAIDRLAARHLGPASERIDADGAIPTELRQLLLENELHHIDGPERHGGSGGDLETALMLVQRVARSSGSVAVTLAASHLYAAACRTAEPPRWEQAEAVASGRWPALVEGGDAPIRATANGDGHVLQGEAAAVEEALRCDTLLVLAESEQGPLLFEIPADRAEIGPARPRTGLRGIECRQVGLEAVEVEPGALLGGAAAVAATAWARLGAAAVAVGLAEAALAEAVTYVRDRRQFGQAIAEFPAVRAMVAEMDAATAAAAAALRSAAAVPTALTASGASARANGQAMRTGVGVATAAVQLHGGYGYMAEFAVERLMRDAISARARGRRRLGDRVLASSILGSPAAPA